MDVLTPLSRAMNPTPALTPQQLVWKARRYLRDAANVSCSAHTRYSAAMSALQCLCLAGIGDGHDQILVDLWEASRYEIGAWPDVAEVAVVVAHVTGLLPREPQA